MRVHRISLRTALTAMMVAVTLCTTLLFNAVYGNMTGEAFSQLDLRLINQNLMGAKARMDETLEAVQGLWDYVQQAVLSREDFAPADFSAAVDPLLEVDETLSSLLLYKRTGSPVAASRQAEGFLSSQNPYLEDWFQAALTGEGCQLSGPRLEHCYRGVYTWVVTLAGPCTYRTANGAENGILAVNLRLSALSDICAEFSSAETGLLTLTNASGETIYSPYAKLQNLRELSAVYANVGLRTAGDRYIEISQPLERGPYILNCRMAESELARSREDNQRRGLLVLGLSLLLGMTMAFLLSAYMARPFRALERTMQGAGAGFPGTRLRLSGCKEFVKLSFSYNAMIDQIESLMRETRENQEQLRHMEIAALEEQINPHFLYNALDSITWLIETQRGPDAIKMVEALAKLLRLSINRGGNFHAVRREVEHIESYLLIQRTRYGQRFDSHIHVERGTEDLLCPRLILQPLVENAIKHGIGDNTDCTIEVRVFLEGDSLVMTVRDDGMGILPDRLRQVQQALRESQPPRPDEISGLALKSVNRRIRLLCGEEWGITIDSETEEYTCVRIALPVRRSA
jgi:two-component system sensor histidine kinase YesM